MSHALAPCPADSDLMKAWNAYKATEEYANSYKWATAAVEHIVLPEPTDPNANRFTEESYRRFADGAMWAAFTAGFAASGGKTTF